MAQPASPLFTLLYEVELLDNKNSMEIAGD